MSAFALRDVPRKWRAQAASANDTEERRLTECQLKVPKHYDRLRLVINSVGQMIP
ncbi:hypothetical protein KIN20_033295 [Parelaphostrongylus tenuis]|uniref:Uncharacterized protein n=1 Tax=Parelaphostrongylus tenuis TaxID=148309 RepID=A0AAD5RA22_PARTN|nr:hypothetical protein KIN20_033295 [Parelaphostrongylus tenuis]